MKKLSFVLFVSLLVIVGCTEEKTEPAAPKELVATIETEEVKKQVEPVEESNIEIDEVTKEDEDTTATAKVAETIDISLLNEIIVDYSLTDGDKLVSADIKNNEIIAVIKLAPNELFSAKDMAITSYSRASDELLNHEGWEVLSVEYNGIGTISMNRNEKKTNEWEMDYFPTAIIMEKLK